MTRSSWLVIFETYDGESRPETIPEASLRFREPPQLIRLDVSYANSLLGVNGGPEKSNELDFTHLE
ncbi:MAG: hypothetical protein WCE61_15005 [Candidatus Acidiferrum sp.]